MPVVRFRNRLEPVEEDRIMRTAMLLLLILFVLALQAVLSPGLALCGVLPDFLFIAVVFLALELPFKRGLGPCFFLGLMRDLHSGGELGFYALLFPLTCTVLSSARKRFFTGSLLLRGGLVFVTHFACDLLYALYLALGRGAAFYPLFLRSVALALSTAAASLPLLFLFQLLRDHIRRPERADFSG
jgi:rod shape-determining protein MreD